MSRAITRRSLSWLRLALLGATWLAGLALPRRDVIVQVVAAQAPARDPGDAPSPEPSSGPPVGWRAAAVRTLPSHYYSFRAAVRRLGPSSGRCADRELLIANGYDHTPQHLARVAFRPAGDACVPEAHPYAWSPRALHYSDVAVADFDRDGRDEIVVAAFAEVGGRMDTGGVYVIGGDDPWRSDPAALALDDDDGYAPSNVAIGDLDADGRLDLIVGTFWRGPRGAGRDIKHVRGDEIDGPTLWFRGLDPISLTFAPPIELGPRGAIDVHLADLDRDGTLDVIIGGRTVTLLFGPDLRDARELPVSDGRGFLVASSVDVTWAGDRMEAWIAHSVSCLSAAECERPNGAFGVALWGLASDRGAPRRIGFWSSRAVISPVRFAHLSSGATPDLIVGVMNETLPASAAAVIGRPYLGALGLAGGLPRVLPGDVLEAASDMDEFTPVRGELEQLRLRTPTAAWPMASSIVTWGDPREARTVHETRHAARLIDYDGPGELGGAEVRTRGGELLPVHHVPGDAHVSLAGPFVPAQADDELDVAWQVIDRPHLVITSACPVAGAAAGTLFIKPPDRGRGSPAGRVPREEKPTGESR